MTTVYLHNLEFYAHHGVPDEEQAVGHRYVVNAEFDLEAMAGQTDAITETLDYSEAAALIVSVGRREQVRTIERLATLLTDALFHRFPEIIELRLDLAKRLPPADLMIEEAGVRIRRRR